MESNDDRARGRNALPDGNRQPLRLGRLIDEDEPDEDCG
jgi:hypothetical protein